MKFSKKLDSKKRKKNTFVWDKLASRYDKLWVQKYSLEPTRTAVQKLISLFSVGRNDLKLLDLGCATGQLLENLCEQNCKLNMTGIDKSSAMVEIAKAKKMQAEFICLDISTDDLSAKIPEKSQDIIVCCHSFPYYKNKPQVLSKLNKVLANHGIMIFVQASINSKYDKIVMSVIEKTAEDADYLPREEFKKLFDKDFVIVDEFCIKEKRLMPSICGFVMKKKGK